MNSATDKDHKKRPKQFIEDMMLLGSLQGFRYFQPWLHGREELLLTIVNEDVRWLSSPYSYCLADSPTAGLNAASLPYEDRDLLMSISREGTARNAEDWVPPASPSEREMAVPGTNCTLFLLAVYAKYQHPYVWIRSNHERLVNISKTDVLARDSPLKLQSICDWNVKNIRIWDVVSELVRLCTFPPPLNPLALDMRYFESLSLTERLLSSGAAISFLQRLITDASSADRHYCQLGSAWKWQVQSRLFLLGIIIIIIVVLLLSVLGIVAASYVRSHQCAPQRETYAGAFDCSDCWVLHKGAFYFVSMEEENWQRSHDLCLQNDAELIGVMDENEKNFLRIKMSPGIYWIGDTESEPALENEEDAEISLFIPSSGSGAQEDVTSSPLCPSFSSTGRKTARDCRNKYKWICKLELYFNRY